LGPNILLSTLSVFTRAYFTVVSSAVVIEAGMSCKVEKKRSNLWALSVLIQVCVA
jgi:hypothetical protein